MAVVVQTGQAPGPLLGGLTVEQTEARKEAVVDARNKRAGETKRSSKTPPA